MSVKKIATASAVEPVILPDLTVQQIEDASSAPQSEAAFGAAFGNALASAAANKVPEGMVRLTGTLQSVPTPKYLEIAIGGVRKWLYRETAKVLTATFVVGENVEFEINRKLAIRKGWLASK